jgi:hypothetical protein
MAGRDLAGYMMKNLKRGRLSITAASEREIARVVE